jgi:hypothetical protein
MGLMALRLAALCETEAGAGAPLQGVMFAASAYRERVSRARVRQMVA